jgi:hypothetical protein
MGETCRTERGGENTYKILLEKLNGRDHSEDRVAGGRILQYLERWPFWNTHIFHRCSLRHMLCARLYRRRVSHEGR